MGSDIFYIATRNIEVGEELRVWYAPHYARKLGKSPDPDGVTTSKFTNQEESKTGYQWPHIKESCPPNFF